MQGNPCPVSVTGELLWFLCLGHSLMPLSRKPFTEICLFTRSTFILECKYFKTKQGLLIGCSIFKNMIQWKMFLKDVGLPLLLFRMCEFMHNSSFTFPGGFPSIYGISKIIRLQRNTEQNLIKWQWGLHIFNTILLPSVNSQYLVDIWRQCCPFYRFACPAFSANLCKRSIHDPEDVRLSYWQNHSQSAEWDSKKDDQKMMFSISPVHYLS